MNTVGPHGNTFPPPTGLPQQPQPPQYTPAPQYATPQQYTPAGTAAPSLEHHGHAQQHMPTPQHQPMSALSPARNNLGLAALIVVAVTAVLGSALQPIITRALTDQAMASYNTSLFFLLQWAGVLIFVPLFVLGLGLGVAGAQKQRSERGKPLAYLAIGGASLGIVMVVVPNLATMVLYGLF